jgi:hypothetical protein
MDFEGEKDQLENDTNEWDFCLYCRNSNYNEQYGIYIIFDKHVKVSWLAILYH